MNREDVKVAAVPQLEGLSAAEFLKLAKSKPRTLRYLPNERDWLHLDKHWICDVLFTLETDAVQAMIDDALVARKEKLEKRQDLNIVMRPEFVKALSSCMSFSSKLPEFIITNRWPRKGDLSAQRLLEEEEDPS